MSYENPWQYNGEIFESDHIQDYFGFVYRISCSKNGRKYLGRKYFWSFRTPPGKKRRVKQESDWAIYWGSNKEILEEIKSKGNLAFTKKIIKLVKTKKELTYWETAYQCKYNVLFVNSYNDNVLGKFFKKDFAPNALLHTL